MDKLKGILGLCRKSGNLAYGSDAVITAVNGGRAKLILVASDAGSNILSRINHVCEPRIIELSGDEMGNAIGRPKTAVVAVLDNNFAKAVLKLIK